MWMLCILLIYIYIYIKPKLLKLPQFSTSAFIYLIWFICFDFFFCIINLKIKTNKSHYFLTNKTGTSSKSLLFSHAHHLPINLKLTLSFPKIKTQNSDSPTATATTDCCHHQSLPLHLLVFLYYATHSLPVIVFNWKSNSIPSAQVRLLSSFYFLWI